MKFYGFDAGLQLAGQPAQARLTNTLDDPPELVLKVQFPQLKAGDDDNGEVVLRWLAALSGEQDVEETEKKRGKRESKKAPPRPEQIAPAAQLTSTPPQPTTAPQHVDPRQVDLEQHLAQQHQQVVQQGQGVGVLGPVVTTPAPLVPPVQNIAVPPPAAPAQAAQAAPMQLPFNPVATGAQPQQMSLTAPVQPGGMWFGVRVQSVIPDGKGHWHMILADSKVVTIDSELKLVAETGKPDTSPTPVHPLTSALAASNLLTASLRDVASFLLSQGHQPKAVVEWAGTKPQGVANLPAEAPAERMRGTLVALGVPTDQL